MRRLALILLVVFACGAPEDDYAGSYGEAKCGVLQPCCAANGFNAFDRNKCILGAAGFVSISVDEAKAAKAIFDRAAASECIMTTKAATSTCTTDALATIACTRIWNGTRKAGEACDKPIQCAHGPTGRSACVNNVCTEYTSPAKLGDVCAATGTPPAQLADCAPSGFQCGFGSNVCVALTPIGSKCPGFTVCEKGAYCDATGTCAKALATGTTCTKNEECASGGCYLGKCAANQPGQPTACNAN